MHGALGPGIIPLFLSLAVLIGLLALAYLRADFFRHLKDLSSKLAALSDGGPARLPESGPPELAEIARVLNRTLTALEAKHEALQRSEARHRLLFESSPDAIMTFASPDWRMSSANPAALQMFGYTDPGAFLALTAKGLWAGELPAGERTAEAVRAITLRVQEQGHHSFEWTFRRLDGGSFPAAVQLTRFELEGKVMFQANLRDISAQKKAEAEQERLQGLFLHAQKLEAVGRLAGGVAHDFNNIVCAMLLQLALLRTKGGVPPGLAGELDELKAQAERAAALTRQLLMFSRKQAIQPKPLELNALMADLLKMLRRLIGEDSALQFEPAPSELWLVADAGMLEQVAVNLVVNAHEAMPVGAIELKASLQSLDAAHAKRHPDARPGRFACLEVTDHGPGMDAETASHAFEPFFTTKGVGQGSGLGLPAVFGIVKQHRGWVEVETAPGKGSTFRVLLPAGVEEAAAQAPRAEADLAAAPPARRQRVLVAEDEGTLRRIFVELLDSLGYEAVGAANGPEAIERWNASGKDFDAVLSDMVMPGGIRGLDLIKRLKEEKPEMGAVLMSGFDPDHTDSDYLERNGIPYLSKPFDLAVLREAVGRALKKG